MGRESFVFGENWGIVDFDKVGAAELVGGRFVRRKHFGGAAVWSDFRDKGAVVKGVGVDGEPKRWGATGGLESFDNGVEEGGGTDIKFGDSSITWLDRDRGAKLCTL